MKKHGKKYRAAVEKIEEGRKFSLDDAVKKLKEIAFAKFDETVELTIWLGVDPRKAGIDWSQFREAQREPARDAVASALVLDEISRRENLTVATEDLDKEIDQFASTSGRTPAALRAQLEKEGGLARLTAGLRREKAVDFAMSHAKMTTE